MSFWEHSASPVCFSDAHREALRSRAHTVLRPVPAYAVSFLHAETARGVTGLGTLGFGGAGLMIAMALGMLLLTAVSAGCV
eukprot:6108880-Amphidinium_carterae.1